MQKYVVIAAGGKGTRARSTPPKQLAVIAGRPVLMHTFEAFLRHDHGIRFVLALPEELYNAWRDLCSEYAFDIPHALVAGGPARFHSVKHALQHIPDNVLVAIHDGVRPVASPELIGRVFGMAARSGNAIPVIPVEESVRQVDRALSSPLDRQRIRLVQTPQCFFSTDIKKAYNRSYQESFTDDATVLEADNKRIFLVEGEKTNIKITSSDDLILAGALLAR